MELEFSGEQDALRESVAAVLAHEFPLGAVRELVEARWTEPAATTEAADALWTTMTDLGWPALTVPGEYGGVGLGSIETAIVAEEIGRALAPGPLFPTLTQFLPALAECGAAEAHAAWYPQVAAGELTGALAVAEATGSDDPASTATTLEPTNGGFLLQGTKQAVMEGVTVDTFAVVARHAGTRGADGLVIALVPRSDATDIMPVAGFDRSRSYATVEFDRVVVPAHHVLGGGGAAVGVTRTLECATTALAAEMVGTGQAIFDIALAYAKERHQFGVPIGSFQSMKHKFADLAIALERARATTYFAALTIAEDDDRRALATAMAKAAAGDAQKVLSKQGIQILGGIGFTWEHDMQMFVRRLQSDGFVFGTAATQRARVADLLGV